MSNDPSPTLTRSFAPVSRLSQSLCGGLTQKERCRDEKVVSAFWIRCSQSHDIPATLADGQRARRSFYR
jgi:hypothetical protein